MQMYKVFIDGSAGTTGLRIYERLSERKDIELVSLTEDKRKDPEARSEALNSADIAFLCLPDAAAVESASFVTNKNTAIIDTSTAHRTADGWEYGFSELKGRKEKIASSKRVANPGCHASGFIALVEPLVRAGIIAKEAHLSCFSLTGYSGGGKKMIADYEADGRNTALDSPAMYGNTQQHKHLPEMSKICSLDNLPVFCPIVAPFYSGMQVTVPLFAEQIKGTAEDIKSVYKDYFKEGLVRFEENVSENGFLYSNTFSGRDDMQVTVEGNADRILLVSRFDNLGKGASGAAIQNMNIIMGVPEDTGLNV
ncbi:MAG: N-acetyl-gamma-glutamyl-phosphate reductase [Ruminococcaceae bacterium]|nr:N-acetyl-gamma-glutamyl-phosphate reductase [Oscillospiraceae bacterium]